MAGPSTDWREQIAPDEETRFAWQTEALAAVHVAKNAQYGTGRLLHRKPILSLRGTFEVLGNLPEFARYGLFAEARSYPAIVRLSNGGLEVRANTKPDIRGFAIKVEGVRGPSSLRGETDHQDFLLINHERFASQRSDEFVAAIPALAKGEAALLGFMFKTYGFIGGWRRLNVAMQMLNKKFTGFANEPFNSVVPIAVGPYAARVRAMPVAPSPAGKDVELDMRDRIAAGPIVYDVALQFFTDETTTPIEDPTVVWPQSQSPFVNVARLTLSAVEADVERLAFDPWGGLAEHRPLGELMRARKSAYYMSQRNRGAV